jgi:predicted CXXCH cytochrome family protein
MGSTKDSSSKDTAAKNQSSKSSNKETSNRRRAFPILLALAVALAAGVLLAAGGFTFAASQESHDTFCTSCHTQPESTYVQRSTDGQQVDLAAFHTAKKTRCIDCHSGSGVTGRMEAELLGARNAAHWYTGTAIQPAKQSVPIRDENCLKCHQDVTGTSGRNNHFHFFLKQWQAADPNAASCVSCHPAHTTDASAAQGYLNEIKVRAVCEACHRVAGRGEE